MRAAWCGALAGLLACASCGSGGAKGGGGEHLPTAGIGPFKALATDLDTPLDEPAVLVDASADLLAPALLDDRGALVAAAGPIQLYAEKRTAAGSSIVRALVDPALKALTPDPELALAPAAAWEGTRVGAPTLIRRAGGVLMFYEGGSSGELGRATSTDGKSFTGSPAPVLSGVRGPTVIASPDDPEHELFLYYGAGGEIRLARSRDEGVSWTPDPAPVLTAGDPAASDGGPAVFDLTGVEDPEAWGPRSPAGAPYVGLYYVGVNALGVRAIGYAGSFDGVHFERAPGGAILNASNHDTTGPAIRRESDRAVLLYGEPGAGHLRISAALALPAL